MFVFRSLYNKKIFTNNEILNATKELKEVVIKCGNELREKIIDNKDPLIWGKEIKLLTELYSVINQVFYVFNEMTESFNEKYTLSENESLVFCAFSDNIELCLDELERNHFIFLSYSPGKTNLN